MDIQQQLCWSQTLLYSIEQDNSAQYEAEKVIFHHENMKLFQNCFESQAIIYGSFGDIGSVEIFISQFYPTKQFSFSKEYMADGKGKIVVVFDDKIIILCLIMPLQKLVQKPFSDKSTEITLFRILQDITQIIVACLSDEILTTWYSGENIPFNDSHVSQLTEFKIQENEQQQLTIIGAKLENLVVENFNDWKMLDGQNSTQFLLYRKIQLNTQELGQFDHELNSLQIQILIQQFSSFSNPQLQMLINKFLSQIFQTAGVILQIVDYSEKFKLQTDLINKKVQEKMKCIIVSNESSQEYIMLNQCYKHLIDNMSFKDGKFTFLTSLQSIYISERLKKIEKKFYNKINELVDTFVHQYKEQMKIELLKTQNQSNNYLCQRGNFSTIRQATIENQVVKVTVSTSQSQFLIDSAKFNQSSNMNSNEDIELISYYQTSKGNSEIIIIKKMLTYTALLIKNNGDIKKITNFEHITNHCFLFVPDIEILYGFNHCANNITKMQIDQTGTILRDNIFYDRQNQFTLSQVIYLSYNQSFIGLTNSSKIVKWSENDDKFRLIKKLFIDKKGKQQQSDFVPSKQEAHSYNQILALPNGSLFLLSNSYIIDIYDLTYQLVISCQIPDQVKIFSDLGDALIVNLGKEKISSQLKQAFVIPNITNRKKIMLMNSSKHQNDKQGNPFFDIMKGSQVKYGPISHFLYQNKSRQSYIYIINYNDKEKCIKEYLQIRELTETCVFEFINQEDCLKKLDKEKHKVLSILRIAYSRVPTQFCTIENNQLIPLLNGFRMQINQNESIAITQRAKLLSLGYIEDYLNKLDENVFVISIIGRQSSGKSYLLNRLFGTRFTVAASRCTDGIWASLSQINGNQFLILDCEGLFSRQRTNSEETQLLSLLAGVCDITILNQDLSFNRYLDELLDNLTNVIGKLKGEKLFKGSLLIALRDINSGDNEGAQDQLLQSIIDTKGKNSKNSNFMTTLFNDTFKVQQFQNFQHNNFSKQIEELRKNFFIFSEKNDHWRTGKELIQTIKILLIQLETKDDENTDAISQKMQIDEAVEKGKKDWIKYPSELKLVYNNREYLNNQYHLWEESNEKTDIQKFCQNLFKIIFLALNLKNEIRDHDSNCQTLQDFISQILQQRKKAVIQAFDNELMEIQKNPQQIEHVKKQKTELIRFIEEQESQYKLCQMQCNQCFLRCSKMACHSSLLQQNIHTIDNELQVLKNEMKQSNSQKQVSNQIENYQAELQKLIIEFKSKQKQLQVYDNLLILLNLEDDKIRFENELLNSSLADSSDCTKINFIKIKNRFEPFENYKSCDKDIIIIDSQDEEYVNIQDLINFNINQKEQLQIIIDKLTTEIEDLKRIDEEIQFQLQQQETQINDNILLNQQNSDNLSQNQKLLQICLKEQQLFSSENQNIVKKSQEILQVLITLPEIKETQRNQEAEIFFNYVNFQEQTTTHKDNDEALTLEMQKEVMESQQIINQLFDQFSAQNQIDYVQMNHIKIQILSFQKLKKIDDAEFQQQSLSQKNENKIIEFIDSKYKKFFEEQIILIKENNSLECILEVENNANICIQEEHSHKLQLLTEIQNDLQKIANLDTKFQSQQENLAKTVNSKSGKEVFNHFTQLLSQRQKFIESLNILSQIKRKLSGKQKVTGKNIPKLELDNYNKQMQSNILNLGITYEQALQEIQSKELQLQSQSDAFEQEYNDLDQVEEIINQIEQDNALENFNQMLCEKKLEVYKSTYLEEKNSLQDQISSKQCDILIILMKLYKLNQVLSYLEVNRQSLNQSKQSQEILEKLNKLELEQKNLLFNSEQLQIIIQEQKENQDKLKIQSVSNTNQKINAAQFLLKKKACQEKIEEAQSAYRNFQELLSSYRSCCEKILVAKEGLVSQFSQKQYQSKNTDEIQNQIKLKTEELGFLEEKIEKIHKTLKDLQSRNQQHTLLQELTKQLDQLKQIELQDHSCQRENHFCDQNCTACNNPMKKCQNKANHQQEHLCDQSKHYCPQLCQIKNCGKQCSKQFKHKGDHSCQTFHQCKSLCGYCGILCQYDFSQQHKDHICKNEKCTQQCSKCKRLCIQNHKHSKKENKFHFCDNIHACSELCTVPGICFSEYIEEIRNWETAVSSFPYKYIRQIDGGKKQCTLEIGVGQCSHKEQQHSCKSIAHRCGAKCPECDGLCTKNYGHSGFHSAAQHRNKDHQVFTLKKSQGIQVKLTDDHIETKQYKVGDSSCPENCKDSCARRQNGHFHLMKCEGNKKCLQTQKNKYARHQQEHYQGFYDVEFDEVLCVEFWRLNKWEHPIQDGNKLANLERCDFYCPFCPKTNSSYCKLSAWHSFSDKYEDHEFQCKESHYNDKIVGMDIAFVIDATGSMEPYIKQAKDMIKKIIDKAKLTIFKSLRFAIVAYRDHSTEEEFLIKVVQLGSEANALYFLEKLEAQGGGDYPEAVLDGLLGAVNLSWLPTHDKMVFLIGDAPPHGKIYSDHSNWPEGCPCKINEQALFKRMQSLGIQLKILQIQTGLAKMIEEFKKHLPSLEVISEDEQFNFVDQVVKKVCKQIEMREITYIKKK